MLGATVQGGWNFLQNIRSGVGKGADYTASAFFPTNQKERIDQEIAAPAGGAGFTYHVTDPDAPSIGESNRWADSGWMGSPYEAQYAVPAKRQESKALADIVSSIEQKPWSRTLRDWLGGAERLAGEAAEIKTVYDEFAIRFGLVDRETIDETPRAGAKDGKKQKHQTDPRSSGPSVSEVLKGIGGGILDQVKGLFNIGYDGPAGSQPAFTIAHEVGTGTKIGVTTIVVIGIVIAVLFLRKRK